jgi:thiol:disulfide interchange protein DsbD
VTVKLPATAPVSNISAATNNQSCPTPALTQQDKISDFLAHSSWFLIAIGFLGFGILLAFTPCVLPMIPILSSIIVGQGEEINTIKAFWLSLIYVLAMAITYAIAGVVAGLAGGYVQAFLQSPWVLGAFSIVFVLLSLSLFGLYELQLPSRFHHHVTHLSNQQTGGTYVGVAIMGCLSTLIVSPCVTAPLIGALSYIGKTGNAVLGGSALFSMGLGMGIPLVIIGTAGGKFLPKAGLWMNTVKAFFGVLMLGVAILLLSRIISPTTTMLLWAALLIISSIYMGAFTQTPATGIGKLWKGLSLIMLVYGFLLLIGAGMGNTNPFQPLVVQRAIPVVNTPQTEPFKIITSLEELQEAIDSAKAQDKPIVLDFYADWCLSCKEMDNTTFEDPRVQVLLSRFVVLRADVTSNDDANKALEHQFNVIAPPTILFFDQNGQELNKDRIVGAVDAATLLKQLKSIIGKQ